VETYVADDFVQHSPHIPPGKAALADFFLKRASGSVSNGRTSFTARVLADGDFVLVHRRVTTTDNQRGTAYADLFRVRDGKVVEHWDVIQPIPPFSGAGRSMVSGPLEPDRQIGAPADP
jgi:predicted SnoaL-like aldol condensation-catalyzing enzyme